ncbi:hypothetical protein [Klebsiella pneumoniae IS43]|uniref:Uncharacterized protein n=1 Tax=Klebsiella pneumoniae IS43 TaxID=1432552 RepID=W1DGI6_KLEPN|nr:hypothetical protein [Klebsiella pneumoniae IS43]CDL53680.1 hypothetical protein [Klebsiella pneumoniae ISC21]
MCRFVTVLNGNVIVFYNINNIFSGFYCIHLNSLIISKLKARVKFTLPHYGRYYTV